MEKKYISKFNEDFIKNYDEDSDKGHILEVDVKCTKNLHYLDSDLPFVSERIKNNKCMQLYAICMIKITILFI